MSHWIDERGRAREGDRAAWIERELQFSDNPRYWLGELYDAQESLRDWRRGWCVAVACLVVLGMCWWRTG
jgi:hypothetical protein